MEFLRSTPVMSILAVLTIYFAIKLIAVVGKFWTPRHRQLTLDEQQLKGWRLTTAMENVGLLVLLIGILVGIQINSYGFGVALIGVAIFAIFKTIIMKKYPYIDPDTVKKKNGKKKKK